MSIGKVFKIMGKNILAFISGAVLGIITVIVLFFPRAIEKMAGGKEGLAVIALVPVFLIIYGGIGLITGGFSGVVIYNIAKLIIRRKK
ncbi:MAG: hypothetical protein Q7R84_02105 [bacterium]|nr:hypothetical protein [bacterium]